MPQEREKPRCSPVLQTTNSPFGHLSEQEVMLRQAEQLFLSHLLVQGSKSRFSEFKSWCMVSYTANLTACSAWEKFYQIG